ncbi:ERI1 exoribonuclease 2-like [Wyeomyia smithii]|uniref:ERI1 exoribonuclease 2-like n=1 Tax=Wyeomyia smithii TaxID=174621 RepID=UPI002467B943|nr:ERI1 exoribonuclease 2-like [Wyeomyia smithii]
MLNLASALNAGNQQKFQYIIVMDLEATCWTKKIRDWQKHEIIEFPAVLLNLATGKIEAEFQQYVKPVEIPKLSKFCIELTGIGQQQVDAGVSLSTCIGLFDKWLKQILAERNIFLPKTNPNDQHGSVAFATWSDWDLGVCLKKECTRKQLSKPAYFDSWIDVKSIYMEFYKYHRPPNFPDSLRNLGMVFEGRAHWIGRFAQPS